MFWTLSHGGAGLLGFGQAKLPADGKNHAEATEICWRRKGKQVWGKSGSPSWTRTNDLGINSPALYQLSYRGKEPGALIAVPRHLSKPPQRQRHVGDGGPERNRTAVEGFADPCLTTRPPDQRRLYRAGTVLGQAPRLAAGPSGTYK